jgi:outer membrane lipoprotein-sorting protein
MIVRIGRPVRMLTLAAAVCLTFGASAADNSLQAVFQRMDQTAAKFKGLTADVTRVAHEGAIGEEETDTGTIAVKLPKPHDFHLLLELKQPDPKSVEVAGTKVQIFFPKANEVQVMDFGRANRAQMEQFLKLGFGSTSRDLQDGYKVEWGGPDKIDGQPATRIVLTPKSQDLAAQFPKFELWISDAGPTSGLAVQQKFYQPGNTYNVATYSNMKVNPAIPDSAVRLNTPKGVKITPLKR